MICCLLLALLAPLGFGAAPVLGRSGAACCTHRRMLFLIAAVGVSIFVFCAMLFTAPQAAPFHHICRFIGVPRG